MSSAFRFISSRAGFELKNNNPKDIILNQGGSDVFVNVNDLIDWDNKTIIWKYHENEGKFISEDGFKSEYFIAKGKYSRPTYRMGINMLVKNQKENLFGVPVTYLVDTASPYTLLQQEILETLKISNALYPKIFINNLPFYVSSIAKDSKDFRCINILGMNVISKFGLNFPFQCESKIDFKDMINIDETNASSLKFYYPLE